MSHHPRYQKTAPLPSKAGKKDKLKQVRQPATVLSIADSNGANNVDNVAKH
jgi:hypothetical protein